MTEGFPESWADAVRAWARDSGGILSVHLYGSRARGDHRPDSDVDLAVRLDDDVSSIDYRGLKASKARWLEQLERLVPVEVHLEVADPERDNTVWPSVQREGRLIFDRGQDWPPPGIYSDPSG